MLWVIALSFDWIYSRHCILQCLTRSRIYDPTPTFGAQLRCFETTSGSKSTASRELQSNTFYLFGPPSTLSRPVRAVSTKVPARCAFTRMTREPGSSSLRSSTRPKK